MEAINYSSFRENLKDCFDKVCEEQEPYIVTRKTDQPNVVVISLEMYNDLIKARENEAYLRKLNSSFDQLRDGRGTEHGLIED